MLKNDLILRNPLRMIGKKDEEILLGGGFGAVLARAGVGKTALMVQMALNALLQSKKILHISLNDPVEKVRLWYKEVFSNIAEQYQVKQIDKLWEDILPYRFIMTFKVEGFSVPKLEERLTDLIEQNIFSPREILIDGLPFDESTRESLLQLKALAKRFGFSVWFSVRTHRHEEPGPEGIPVQLLPVVDLFDVAIELKPEGKDIYVRALKGGGDLGQPPLMLDPSTMLLKDTNQSA